MRRYFILLALGTLSACSGDDGITIPAPAADASGDSSSVMTQPDGSAPEDSSMPPTDGPAPIDSAGCASGQAMCEGICKTVSTDLFNCGGCGSVCGRGKPALSGGGVWACESGACVVQCPGSKTACNDQGCFDTTSDDQHCGSCGNACSSSSSCCGGSCIDTNTDHSNCGGCGTACSSATTCCSGGCSNTNTDALNCGSCGNACTFGMSCCGGGCTDTNTDSSNCGACGTKCTGACSAGTCCSAPTKGSCGHSLCLSGGHLSSGCDGSQGCVAKVCSADSYCCTTAWDATCESEVQTYCSPLKCGC